MKLTATQLQTIESYLLSWELQFRDFYDEMFDHFCTEIEQQMDEGTSFDDAFAETSYLFSGREFTGNGFFGYERFEFYNIKAMELERFHSLRKKYQIAFFDLLKNQFLSWRIVVWIALFSAATVFLNSYEKSVSFNLLADTFYGGFVGGGLLGLGIGTIGNLFANIPLSETLFKYIFRAIRKRDLDLGKRYQLFENSRLHAFVNLALRFFGIYFTIFSVFIVFELEVNLLILSLIAGSFLIISYCFMLLFIENKAKLIKQS